MMGAGRQIDRQSLAAMEKRMGEACEQGGGSGEHENGPLLRLASLRIYSMACLVKKMARAGSILHSRICIVVFFYRLLDARILACACLQFLPSFTLDCLANIQLNLHKQPS
jgi:hypothetical protein